MSPGPPPCCLRSHAVSGPLSHQGGETEGPETPPHLAKGMSTKRAPVSRQDNNTAVWFEYSMPCRLEGALSTQTWERGQGHKLFSISEPTSSTPACVPDTAALTSEVEQDSAPQSVAERLITEMPWSHVREPSPGLQ